MADACVGELGEVEQKMVNLVEEVFTKYPSTKDDEGNDCITESQIKEFIKLIMEDAGEGDAWDDKEFEECYKEFDYDGNGTISKGELTQFIKRFAAL
jgi:Ca2+-binding EF-hand superfamily protein